jgi:hypothetical protein
MTLMEDTVSFLTANGYLISRVDSVLVSATRPSLGGVSDQVLVWVPEESYGPADLRLREEGYLRRFEGQSALQGQKFLLVQSTEGFSAEFRRQARGDHGVSVTVPIQFFDTSFKWDNNSATATAASNLRGRGTLDRIRQPFVSSIEYESYDDLLSVLVAAFRASNKSPTPVHLVTAPAGFGKSYLFQALFAQIYDEFMDAKRAQIRALRPLPLLPEYLASATAPTLKALVSAFLTTDMARPLNLDSFEWMLSRGYACFLLDGLDEVISRDPLFFEYLSELLTRPDSPYVPRILICVRDSLLASNKGLRDFLDDAGPEVVHHRLTSWQRPSIETYVQGKLPPVEAERLLSELDSHPNLMALAGTPFYCQVLTESQKGENGYAVETIDSETQLMSTAVTSMVRRELDKGLLEKHWSTPAEIESLLQDIIEEDLDGGSRGVRLEDIEELATLSLPDELQEHEIEVAVERLKQLPFLSSTSDLRRVSFSQEVVYDYLLGVRASAYLSRNPKRFLRLMSAKSLAQESATARVIHEQLGREGTPDDLYRVALDATGDPIAFRNVLQLILALPDTEWMLRRLPLERQDLSGLRFAGMNLTNVSFRGANLEAVVFRDCDIQHTVFAEAIFKTTEFNDCRNSRSVEFGDLSSFFSALVDGTLLEGPEDFVSALGVTSATESRRFVQPCPSAQQLRFLFAKYVRPDGGARRDWLDEKSLLSGKRYVDPGPVLEAAKKHGYLEWDSARHRYVRSRGDEYSDMVGLVSKLLITPRLRVVLAEICRTPGCRHVLEVSI